MVCILGVITAQGEIDYEGGAEYKIEVKAQNPGTQLSSTAAILVHVTGVNEYKPEFLSRDYTFTIREDQQPGSSIGGVSATDTDKGTDGVVYYYLVGDSNLQVCSHISFSNIFWIQDCVPIKAHLYWSEGDVASNLLRCFQSVCLYYSNSNSDKDQRKKLLLLSL